MTDTTRHFPIRTVPLDVADPHTRVRASCHAMRPDGHQCPSSWTVERKCTRNRWHRFCGHHDPLRKER